MKSISKTIHSALLLCLIVASGAKGLCEESNPGTAYSFDFNNSSVDSSSQFTASSATATSYVTEGDITAVSLSGSKHFRFPIELSQLLTEDSIRFRMQFKVVPDSASGMQNGRLFLFGNERQSSGYPGFRMDLRYDGNNLFLVQTAGDGLGGDQRQGELGKVQVNQWYSIDATLEMGRESPRIEYIFDDNLHFHRFSVDDGFSLEKFRDHLSNINPLQVGGTAYYPSGDTQYGEEDTGATLLVDYFVVEPSVVPGDSAKVQQVFNQLLAHLDGSSAMTEQALKDAKMILYQEMSPTSAKASFSGLKSFLESYESKNDPLFLSGTRTHLNELEMTAQIVFFVKQWMLDNFYTSDNLMTLEGIAFEEAEVWPGVPKTSAPRTTSGNPASLQIDATYNHTKGVQFNGSGHAYRMTGCYAAPGERVSLTFPPEAVNQKLQVMVGVHFWDTYYVRPYNRLNRISISYPIDDETIDVMNPIGGTILIRIPDGSNLGTLPVTIVNAVRTPYYSTRSGFETTDEEWETAKASANVPWVEFESDKTQLSAPRALFDAGELTPQQILSEWDSILDAFSIVGGHPLDRARPYFFMADRQHVAGGTAAAAANPLPLVPHNSVGSWENFLDPKPNSNSDGVSLEFIVLHEMGHAHNYPTLGNQEKESNVNLPIVAAYNLTYGYDLTTKAMAISTGQGLTLDQSAIDWMISPNFPAKNPVSVVGQSKGNGSRVLGMGMDYEEWDKAWKDDNRTEMVPIGNEIRYQPRGHAKFVELAGLYGWEAVGKMHGTYMKVGAKGNHVINYNVKDDDLIRKASHANNKNLAPIFHFWGITPTAELVKELNVLPKATEFKARLNHYRGLIPADNAAFRTYFATLQTGTWTKGYWSDQGNGFQVYRYKGLENAYNEARAKEMSDQIDYLLAVYFPEGDTGNQPPVIVSGPTTQRLDGNNISLSMNVTDTDTNQDHLRYSIHFADPSRRNYPDGLKLNPHTGELYGNLSAGYKTVPLKIGVFDGTNIAYTDPFQLFALDADSPAVAITNLTDLEVVAGQSLSHVFNYQGSTDGVNLSIRTLYQPDNDFSPTWLNKTSSEITLTPTADDIGEYRDLFLTIQSPTSYAQSVLFSIRVLPSDDSFQLTGTPPAKFMAMRPFSFTPTLLKGAGVQESINFTATNLPAWLSLDESTGRIFGIPTADDGGTYSGVTITASNSSKSASFGPFSIEVGHDNKLKVLNLNSAYTFSLGETFEIPIVLESLGNEDSYNFDSYTNLRFADSKPYWIRYTGRSRPARLYGTVPNSGVDSYYKLEFNVHGRTPFQSLDIFVLDSTDQSAPNPPTFKASTSNKKKKPTLKGTAEPGSVVTLFKGPEAIGTSTTDTKGNFSHTLSQAMAAGSHTITAKATDVAGNISELSSVYDLVIESEEGKPRTQYISRY